MLNLKKLRQEKKYSQQKLADILNVSRSTVAMWETNASEPSNEMLRQIADIFGVSTDYLLGKEDAPAPQKDALDGVEFAFYGDVSDFTEEERQDLADFVEFIRSKRKGKTKEE